MEYGYRTHDVTNQPPPIGNVNLFLSDPLMVDLLRHSEASWCLKKAESFGAVMGAEETAKHVQLADLNRPELQSHDRYGHRIDEVLFHPSWHHLMSLGVAHGLHNGAWTFEGCGAHQARATLFYLFNQAENGAACPLSMTHASFPTLRHSPSLLEQWVSGLKSNEYDGRFIDATKKRGLLVGMAMTEKQGGSDVRRNTTKAKKHGEAYLLTGHKWFCSAPMCDGFLTLAYIGDDLTCFLVPRWTPGGDRNRIHIQRLKDKLGNRSNASSEIEYHQAWAQIVGDPGRGISTILEMVAHTRLDCVLGSVGIMRAALNAAIHHCKHRQAFGRRLIEQPVMRQVLADLILEWRAALVFAWELAVLYDKDTEKEMSRLLTAVAKFWICKRTPMFVAEALECVGGSGYVAEFETARLFRESPLNAIWEGSGNVIAIDIQRTLTKFPHLIDRLIDDLNQWGKAPEQIGTLRAHYDGLAEDPILLRHFSQNLAVLIQAMLLDRRGDVAADDFLSNRVVHQPGLFGAGQLKSTDMLLQTSFG
ncbi:MAG: acyl-CoA dehydrogenase family protein [Acidobacteria bacterium]|nr:acyl-CoA dehydrogenase family protein [Acidobacteriota bacterium]